MTYGRNTTIKYCAYSMLLIVLYLIQSSRGVALTVFGLRLDFMPYLVAAIALFEGPYGAGVVGFFIGIMCASGSPMVDGLLSLYYGLAGALCGEFCKHRMRKVIPSALLVGLCIAFFRGLIGYLCYYVLLYGAPLLESFYIIVGEALLPLPVGALIYLFVRTIYLHFMEKDET